MDHEAEIILPLMREMRGELNNRFDAIERRLKAIEARGDVFGKIATGEQLMSKVVARHFETRIDALEARVRELQVAK